MMMMPPIDVMLTTLKSVLRVEVIEGYDILASREGRYLVTAQTCSGQFLLLLMDCITHLRANRVREISDEELKQVKSNLTAYL